jgi:hypothetical protein
MAKTSSLQKARLDPCPFLESCFINRVERINECLCAGITAWSPRDIFNAGSSAVYFVGDPEAVASNAKIYPDDAGLSALILSGWPLIEEARNVEAWRQGGDRPGVGLRVRASWLLGAFAAGAAVAADSHMENYGATDATSDRKRVFGDKLLRASSGLDHLAFFSAAPREAAPSNPKGTIYPGQASVSSSASAATEAEPPSAS